MRVIQPIGTRGSLKWMQRAVADRWEDLERDILNALPTAKSIEWLSPLLHDEMAEYRDEAWLERIGCLHLNDELMEFWPRRGPQWDALARTDAGHVLVFEAKAHIGEFCSPPSQASGKSRLLIEASMQRIASDLGVPETRHQDWLKHFYQYADRLAHLHWLRSHDVDAKLVLLGFVNDDEMPGNTTPEAWRASYILADHVLGLPSRHKLRPHIIHLHPSVESR